MTFVQRHHIRDYIFPIAEVEGSGSDYAFRRFLGTGFLIGSRGFALTAGHVVTKLDPGSRVAALFVDAQRKWRAFGVTAFETHPTEDVAVLTLEGGPWRSFLQFRNYFVVQSLHYRLFGYPDDVLREIVARNQVVPRPDLIYSEGYVRRRLSMSLPLPQTPGSHFLELSAPAGRGCSGSPVMTVAAGPTWNVIGIYVGERMSEDASVGYAVRAEAICDWEPELVHTSILLESQTSPAS